MAAFLSDLSIDNWRSFYTEIHRSGLFDYAWYARTYPDVFLSGLTPLEHYVKYGASMGRLPRADCRNASEAGLFSAAVAEHLANVASRREAQRDRPEARVTILCITYNQAAYIQETLESLLSQKADFGFRIIVGDDGSVDGTADILRDYAERHDNLTVVLRTKNIGANANFADIANRVETEYVAICEGDDYWCDDAKLATQVAFLDRKPEFSICFHPVRVVYEGLDGVEEIFPQECPPELSLYNLAHRNYIQTNSVMYRWRFGANERFELPKRLAPGDWYIHLLHAEVGRIGFINLPMAVYRKTKGGMWASHAHALARHKKHGGDEIKFYEHAAGLFGGVYGKDYQTARMSIFATLFDAYLSENDVPGMLKLFADHPDLADETLAELGIKAHRSVTGRYDGVEVSIRERLKVSVVVTCFNQVQYIERCLDSVLAQQGMFDLEVIVGDDRSTDGTMEIVRRYRDRHPDIIKLVDHRKNVGMLMNMKACLDRCSGNYVAFCEGDDYWMSNGNVARKLSVLRKDSAALMCFSWVLLLLEGANHFAPHNDQGKLSSGKISFFELANAPLTANFSCCLYKASAIRVVPASFYEGSSSADWLFNLYIAEKGDVHFLREMLTVYNIQDKGQWSGLPDAVKTQRIGQYKSEFSEIFGRERGFERLEVRTRVHSHPELLPGDILKANLDAPSEGVWAILNDGKIRFQGWILSKTSAPISMIIKVAEMESRFPIDIFRPDVVKAVMGDDKVNGIVDRCGFSFSVDFNSGRRIALSVEVNGDIFPWIDVEVESRVLAN